ncbi:Alpha/Beta hydrolase protein [Cadophora sp. MPI-SDFR-AT-0126]|nr:Alpha/Beta hydrolase protein [Leotiomycetes sp. MPI-SDFR-AT-0126]
MQQLFYLSHISATLIFFSQALALPYISPRTNPKISWANCTTSDPPGLQCGQIEVPVDYDNAHADQFNITFARLQATNATSRIGSLIINPGGPGGAGSDLVFGQIQGAPLFSPELLAQYDIIGLDPRGTGLSNPMVCDPTIWNQRVSSTPKNEEEFNKLVEYNKAFSESCKAGTGRVFDFMGTASAAKDMDMVRRALQEDKLNFLGISYGSNLGSTYAGLFPTKVGRMVLDGILAVSDSDTSLLATESGAYEATLNQFFKWCNTTSDCALNGQDAPGIFDDIIATANEKPIPAPGCTIGNVSVCRSDATGEEILSRVQSGILFVEQSVLGPGWPLLSVAIAQASRGNATLLSARIKSAPSDSDFSFLGVACKDWAPTSKSYIDLVFKRQMTTALSPHSRGNSQTYQAQSSCIGWVSPPTPVEGLRPKQVAKLPKILLANSFWDPSTSIVWANTLRQQIPSSVLLLRNGSGHTSYFSHGKISTAMDTFLLTGVLPAQGTVFDS